MITQENIRDIAERVDKLKNYLQIDQKKIEISNDEEKAADPEFWNNPREAESFMRVLRGKKKWVEDYQELVSLTEELGIFYDFFKDGESSEAEIQKAYDNTFDLLEDLEEA